ncbi:MAG: hypothetical protein LJE58_13640 [Thiogranum sp.]|jgi:hypothetical protein|nr:hypothetical protein [Thiogranum sp.]
MLIDRIHCARLLILLLVLPAPLLAAPVAQDEPTVWDTTRDGAEHAIDWTVEKSQRGWEATREGAVKAFDWSVETSSQGWDATREGTGKAVDWTVDKSRQGWEATREGVSKSVEWVKEKTSQTDAPDAAQHWPAGFPLAPCISGKDCRLG